MSSVLSAVVSIAAILLIGNLLIVAHELGHYGAARTVGVTARRFVIGVGPTLLQRVDRRGTEWTLSLLPFGGYVNFYGERGASSTCGYAAQSPFARMAIIAAGPITNLTLAFVVFASLLAIQGKPTFLPVATSVVQGSAADRAGFEPGDRIVAVDGIPIATLDDLRPALQPSAGRAVRLQVARGGKHLDLSARLSAVTQDGKSIGFLGIRSNEPTQISLGLIGTAGAAAAKTWGAITDTLDGVSEAVTTGRGTQNFTGLLGITQLAGQAAVAGDTSIFTLIAILSANLALMNLLPLPILDGGALLFCMVEWIRGRPASARLQDIATRVGVAAMATLFMLSMLHDLIGFGVMRP